MLSLKRTLQHTAGLICLAAVGSAQNDLIHLQANMALGLEDSTLIQIDNPMTLGQSMIVDLDLEGLPMTLDLAPFSVRSKNRPARRKPAGTPDNCLSEVIVARVSSNCSLIPGSP